MSKPEQYDCAPYGSRLLWNTHTHLSQLIHKPQLRSPFSTLNIACHSMWMSPKGWYTFHMKSNPPGFSQLHQSMSFPWQMHCPIQDVVWGICKCGPQNALKNVFCFGMAIENAVWSITVQLLLFLPGIIRCNFLKVRHSVILLLYHSTLFDTMAISVLA